MSGGPEQIIICDNCGRKSARATNLSDLRKALEKEGWMVDTDTVKLQGKTFHMDYCPNCTLLHV